MTGKDIQTWRKSKRLSVQQVADHIGISHRTLQGWESGRFSIPGPKQKRVAELLRKEAVAMKIDADTFAKLAAKAKEKGFPSAESFANDLLSKLLIAVIYAAPLYYFLPSSLLEPDSLRKPTGPIEKTWPCLESRVKKKTWDLR